jgi:hypothetical protein
MHVSFLHVDGSSDIDNILFFANTYPTTPNFRNIFILDKYADPSIITKVNSKLSNIANIEWVQNTLYQGRVPSLMYAYNRLKNNLGDSDILCFHISQLKYSLGINFSKYTANTLAVPNNPAFFYMYGSLAVQGVTGVDFSNYGILNLTKSSDPFILSVLEAFRGKGNEALVLSFLANGKLTFVKDSSITGSSAVGGSDFLERNDDIFRFHNLAVLESIFKFNLFPSASDRFRRWLEDKKTYTLLPYFSKGGFQTLTGLCQGLLKYSLPSLVCGGVVLCFNLTNQKMQNVFYLNSAGQLVLPAGTYSYMDGRQVVNMSVLDKSMNYIIFRTA